MDRLEGAVAFFDIGDTLAAVTVSSGGGRIEQLHVYPYVPEVLAALRDFGARIGIISDRGPFAVEEVNRALKAAGLWKFFDPELVIYGRKDTPRIFERAAARAGTPERRLFVGEDAGERALAMRTGYAAAPHPLLALPVLHAGEALRYVRVTAPPGHAAAEWRAELRRLPLLPAHVTGEAGTTVYAVATVTAAARLDDLGFWVDRLGAEHEPLSTDLFLLSDDRQVGSGFLTLDGNSTGVVATGPGMPDVLASTAEGLFVAVPGGSSVERFHFRGAFHGHNLKLTPSTSMLDDVGFAAGFAAAPSGLASASITPAEKEILDLAIDGERMTGHVERYAGARPAAADGAVIASRHIHHTDNALAVATLVTDLERIGAGRLAVRRHRFSHEGRSLENVEAELPGGGLDGVVLITAHMDSTGARQPGYRPALDTAPGADDDGSGVAGVLTAAEAFMALDTALQVPRRTVRFLLFNAEEHGLVGSRAYARDQAVAGTPIVAALQMDMIGYDVLPEPTFELHAGFTPASGVEAQSLALAQMVADLRFEVSGALSAPQIYPAAGGGDPAERRSDHYSFQAQGYAACLVSEDLFPGPGAGAPPEEMNPHYHLPTDATINGGYAADIARLVTAAGWVAATR